MANAPVTTLQVMAKAIQIMTNQMKDSRNPEMKRRLRNKIDYFSSFGVVDNYKMIVYSNSITLIHNDYQNYPNINLFDDGKLYIGTFDKTLTLHDQECIRIHGNGKADSGACLHGYVEGDCVTESVEREKGKEVKYQYQSHNPYGAAMKGGKRVKNDKSRSFLQRLLKNETIGQGDYFKAVLCFIGIGIVLAQMELEFLMLIPGIAFLFITHKRIKDVGYSGGTAIVLLIVCMMLQIVGFIILCLMATQVVTEEECNKVDEKLLEELELAQKRLKTRCDTYNGTIGWLLINAETLRIMNSMTGGAANTSQGQADNHDDSYDKEEDRQREEEERREEERRQHEEDQERREEEYRQQRISSLESEIRHLEGRISSLQSVVSRAESQASSRRQQGETYLSYANSAQDDDQRNDYLQSADSCFSEASQYESEAASAESEISSLQSEVDSLYSEINSL